MEDDFFSITNEDLVNMFNNMELIYQNRIISLEDLANLLYIDLENGVCKIDDTKILFAKMSEMKEKVHNVEEAYKILNRKVFGENDVQLKSQKTFINILKSNMNDKTLIILTIAAMFSIAIGIGKMFLSGEKFGVVEGVSILVAVVIIVLVGTINEYSQEILFRNLEKKKTEKLIKVYKNKNLETIHISDITVGDIVYLEPGDLIPADCILVSKNPLFCDESLVTGEVEGIEKNINHPFLMSGSYVMNGLGRAMVICVGENSFKGKILKSLEVERKNTPLQEKIEVLTSNIAMKAIYISIILFIAQLLKLFFVRRIFKIDYVLEIFIESIALAAMAIPEGLPIAITLALSFGTKRMLKQKSLVRDMAACEIMNNTNYLCTDKTGTLTHNVLRITRIYTNKNIHNLSTIHNEITIHANHFSDLMVFNSILNSTAFINKDGIFIGNRIECALLEYLIDDNIDYKILRRKMKAVKRKEFDSKSKYMSTIVKHNGKYLVLFKGASEIIIDQCSKMDVTGKVVDIERNEILHFLETSNKNCLRTISMCYQYLDIIDENSIHLEGADPIFLCSISFEDPLRKNIYEQIDLFKTAGINLVMLTGDNMEMAKYLGRKTGILSSSYKCIKGEDMRNKTDEELLKDIHSIRVIARAQPDDKRRFVQLLQNQGNIVAVTGDGTNDGPALKLADVGFAMGMSGSDVAQEAASVVILNDDFFSLLKVVSWGRCINDSIRKFIQFQLSVTGAALGVVALSTIFYSEQILNPLQILWINLYMDSFSALSLSTDQPTNQLFLRSPESVNTPIITNYMKLFMASTVLYQYLVMIVLILFGASKTFIFNTFFFLQIFNQINARSIDVHRSPFSSITANKIYLTVNVISVVLQIVIVQELGVIFGTKPLSFSLWILSVFVALSIIPFFEIVRNLERRRVEKTANGWRKLYSELNSELRVIESFKKMSRLKYYNKKNGKNSEEQLIEEIEE